MLISNDKLKSLAVSVGVDHIGIASTDPPLSLKNKLLQRLAEGRTTSFEEKDPVIRLSPDRLLAGCRSIIVMALPYQVHAHRQNPSLPELRGKVARCAQGVDYHTFIEQKARQIIELIQREAGSSFNYRILADRSPLVERELAQNAGLGWIGKNCNLITLKYGSYTVIGTILLDKEIHPDTAVARSCDDCDQCQRSCPTGALGQPFLLDPNLCLSYLTQASGVVPRELRQLLGNRLYGCDSCQEGCPHNETAECSPFSELAFSFFPDDAMLIPLLRMTRREFDLSIGITAAGWRGKTTIQRNAVIALGNSGDTAAVQPLSQVLKNDSRPLLRLHAAWALGRIKNNKARNYLESSMRMDPIDPVREEAAFALENSN
ncbi:MAG TPA: tRNA epoxyqueuosine(34) reductase QueG [Candidatus Limnocylindrales bacterium]|nr:tRNA epoxyqueuosine(34) reductase QueG [Candidatus Limnocylindrales bacterium]